MKNLHKILGLALGAGVMLGGTSCKESFLDVDHYGIVNSDAITESNNNLTAGLIACYAEFHQKTNGDEMKPNLWVGCHPTMDTQCTGWDKDWLKQNWIPKSYLMNGRLFIMVSLLVMSTLQLLKTWKKIQQLMPTW